MSTALTTHKAVSPSPDTYESALRGVVDFYETLTPNALSALNRLYAADATFRDPFNNVQGVDAITRIFSHMFHAVDEPSFRVLTSVRQGDQAFLVWRFRFRQKGGKRDTLEVEGSTHVCFGADGKVTLHRDYWDAAEELYEKFPVLGPMLRWLKKRLRAT